MMINVEERKHELNRRPVQGWKAEGKIYSLQQILLVKEARRTQPSDNNRFNGTKAYLLQQTVSIHFHYHT